jgi:hypothetical protein
MNNYLAIGFALAVIAGCGNQEQPKTAAPAPPAARQDAPPAQVTPPPAPANAVADGVQRPTPGQANDHSNPEFKAGGKADTKK